MCFKRNDSFTLQFRILALFYIDIKADKRLLYCILSSVVPTQNNLAHVSQSLSCSVYCFVSCQLLHFWIISRKLSVTYQAASPLTPPLPRHTRPCRIRRWRMLHFYAFGWFDVTFSTAGGVVASVGLVCGERIGKNARGSGCGLFRDGIMLLVQGGREATANFGLGQPLPCAMLSEYTGQCLAPDRHPLQHICTVRTCCRNTNSLSLYCTS